jgi:mannose-6-phosphate isomerase-like protein (cupin superfamily)
MSDDVIHLGPNQDLRVISSTPERLVLDARWRRGDAPPAHFHPSQEEHFEIFEGELTVVLGNEPPRLLRAGDTLEIAPGTVHKMWNALPGEAHAAWEVCPALRTEELFRRVAAGVGPDEVAALLEEFSAEMRLAS